VILPLLRRDAAALLVHIVAGDIGDDGPNAARFRDSAILDATGQAVAKARNKDLAPE
jgi:hypothetical protein